MKFCIRCRQTKSDDSFYKNKLSKDGIDNYCSKCRQTVDINRLTRKELKEINIKRVCNNLDIVWQEMGFK